MTEQQTLQQQQIEASLKTEFENWVRQSPTQLFLQALQSYEESTIKCLIRDLSPTNTLSAYHHGNCIKTIRDIKQMILSPEIMIKRITSK